MTALKYTNAVLLETLKIFPAAPGSLPRIVPQPGAFIAGRWVPGSVRNQPLPNVYLLKDELTHCEQAIVGVHQYSANHSSSNFHRADEFLPERWLSSDTSEAEEFQNDDKAAAQPFSYGHRICLGQK